MWILDQSSIHRLLIKKALMEILPRTVDKGTHVQLLQKDRLHEHGLAWNWLSLHSSEEWNSQCVQIVALIKDKMWRFKLEAPCNTMQMILSARRLLNYQESVWRITSVTMSMRANMSSCQNLQESWQYVKQKLWQISLHRHLHLFCLIWSIRDIINFCPAVSLNFYLRRSLQV